jgi:hypothetical protein
LAGFRRQGDVSCGGGARLLQAQDGWIALSLARPDDCALVPAWLELDDAPGGQPALFEHVGKRVAAMPSALLIERGRLLGLPIAGLASVPPPGEDWHDAVIVTQAGRRRPPPPRPVVVDLSSMWAGPLCSAVWLLAGARVIKVESSARPDGARYGSPAFFDLLNAGKESLALDFACAADVQLLQRLLLAADVVVEASRPRALEQLGIAAAELVVAAPKVWISITGYGRTEPGRDWVAFGDDAAVAGGLVAWDGERPCFCADAIADPLAGLVAAAAGLTQYREGRSGLLDVALARVAAAFAGPTITTTTDVALDRPRTAASSRRAACLGGDSHAIRRQFRA